MTQPPRSSPAQQFVVEHAHELAKNLAHHCAVAAKEICDSLAEAVPSGLDLDAVYWFLLTFRAPLELRGVAQRFGQEAEAALRGAMGHEYRRDERGGPMLQVWEAALTKTMGQSTDPREWPRIHAVHMLGTRDPEDEMFHLALAHGITYGQPIAAIVDLNARSLQ